MAQPRVFAMACCLAWAAVEVRAGGNGGKELFDAMGCRACHRVGASGGNAGPDLTWVGFRRGREWLDRWLQDPRAWKPGALMPDLRPSPKARAALVEYLSSLRGQGHGDRPPWRGLADLVQAGRRVYLKAGCVACHGPGGRGGEPNNNVPGRAIPALDRLVATYTPEELARRIRSGARPVKEDPTGPEPLVSMPAWGEALTEPDIEAVASYLMTLAAKGAPGEDW